MQILESSFYQNQMYTRPELELSVTDRELQPCLP